MPLVVSGALVLGAVNLVTWVISLERGAKESLQTELKLAQDGADVAHAQGGSLPAGIRDHGYFRTRSKCLGGIFSSIHASGCPGMISSASPWSMFPARGWKPPCRPSSPAVRLHAECRHTSSPAAILSQLNRGTYTHSRRDIFVAFLLAALDPVARTITFANAGQTKPLLPECGSVTWLDRPGLRFPLGMQQDTRYEERNVQLNSGISCSC